MPWLSQPPARPSALHRRAVDHRYVPFYACLLEMPPDGLLALWADQPDVDEPRAGRVHGGDAFVQWAMQTREWLLEAEAAIRAVDVIVTPARTVEEVTIDLTIDGERRELPVAVVAERNGLGLTGIRVYHSMWPLIRGHVVRSPLLPADPNLTIPDVVGHYQRALAAGDLDGILATYQDDAVVREPAGLPYVYSGKQALRHIYTLQFADGAGIPLQICAVTDDGRSCALEWTATMWGRTPIDPQAGIAVYQRGEGGKLAAARIYDDLDPPPASDSSHNRGSGSIA